MIRILRNLLKPSRESVTEKIIEREAAEAVQEAEEFWKKIYETSEIEVIGNNPRLVLSEAFPWPAAYNYGHGTISVNPYRMRHIAKYLEKKHFAGYELRPLVFAIIAHERGHHFQDNSKIVDVWNKYLQDSLVSADESKANDDGREKRIKAFREDQADYFAGMFVNYAISQGKLHESAREFVEELFRNIGADKEIAHAMRPSVMPKEQSMRTSGPADSMKGGHAQGSVRADLISHTAKINDSNFAEFAKYGIYEAWK